MAKKKKQDEVEQEHRTKITVCRVFGEQNILELYADYVAEKAKVVTASDCVSPLVNNADP